MSWSPTEQAELRAHATAYGADLDVRLDFEDDNAWITVHTSRGGDSPCACFGLIDPPNLLQARLAIEREIARARSQLQAGR